MRLQLALNVTNLEHSVAYYSKMFGTEPHKLRKGYANFAIEDPAVKLVFIENPDANDHLNHLGVEMFDPHDIDDTANRFKAAGILETVLRDSACCHADQDKVWIKEPGELSWEWYVINHDHADIESGPDASACCSGLNRADTACG